MMLGERKYAHIWGKYRPMILSLMKASLEETQTYQLSNHEFVDINPKKTTGYSFSMQIHERKSVNDIRKSLLAPDLMAVLRLSGKAMELSDTAAFSFDLDKTFLLKISSVPNETLEASNESEEEVVVTEEKAVTPEEVSSESEEEVKVD
jgi:hypothetical protein